MVQKENNSEGLRTDVTNPSWKYQYTTSQGVHSFQGDLNLFWPSGWVRWVGRGWVYIPKANEWFHYMTWLYLLHSHSDKEDIETHTYTQNQQKKTTTTKKQHLFCSKENCHHHTGCFSKTLSSFQLAPPMPQLLPIVGVSYHFQAIFCRISRGTTNPRGTMLGNSLHLHL